MTLTEATSIRAFNVFLATAAVGDRAIYYRGHFAADASTKFTKLPFKEMREVAELGAYARDCYERGYVLLMQKRDGDSRYLYIAQRTKATLPEQLRTPARELEDA